MCPSDPDPRLDLPEYAPESGVALTDAERWPARSAAGAARLQAVRERPDAPAWTHRTGDRLDAAALARVMAPRPLDGWLERHLEVARRLPAYRRRSAALRTLEDFPTISRADLAADVSRFVPLDADLSRAIAGSSSGSTGAALSVPDDPEELARGLLGLAGLARDAGADWRPSPDRVALAHLVAQRSAYTYASTMTAFREAPMVRLNLTPAAWPGGSADRDAYLAAIDPQVLTGAPIALTAALAVADRLRPLAVVSSATALTPALRAELEAGFRCPVLDLYGLHETRSIAVRADDGPFLVLARRVLVEVLDDEGRPLPPGDRGEIVVTAGENPFLPLVRYRTGDTGRLVDVAGRPAIADLEGRETVRFRTGSGGFIPSVDLTQQLQAAGALGWRVEQDAGGRIDATIAGGDLERARAALEALLDLRVRVDRVEHLADLGPGKPRRYRSETADTDTPRAADRPARTTEET